MIFGLIMDIIYISDTRVVGIAIYTESARQLGGVYMATSSIFTQVEITDAQAAERFVTALEESEKAQARKKRTAPVIPIVRDKDEIRKLMAQRFPVK